jgi:hypothetical protein
LIAGVGDEHSCHKPWNSVRYGNVIYWLRAPRRECSTLCNSENFQGCGHERALRILKMVVAAVAILIIHGTDSYVIIKYFFKKVLFIRKPEYLLASPYNHFFLYTVHFQIYLPKRVSPKCFRFPEIFS